MVDVKKIDFRGNFQNKILNRIKNFNIIVIQLYHRYRIDSKDISNK